MTTQTTRLRLDAAALNAGGQLNGLCFDAQRERMALVDRVLVEDDAPAIG